MILSVACTESGWNALAIPDDATGQSIEPETRTEAERIAARLIAEDHRPDLGLIQINSANLAHTALTVSTAFEPSASILPEAEVPELRKGGARRTASDGAEPWPGSSTSAVGAGG